MSDSRPKTVVMHQSTGMGDLVWHTSYFKAIAEQSFGGKVCVIASPTTFARDLVGHEPWIEDVIDFDRSPRKSDRRRGRHSGLRGFFSIAGELRKWAFDRIIVFSHRPNRGFVAWWAGIPTRLGFGSHLLQRIWLSRGPYIRRYSGPADKVYQDMTAFALAHGFSATPLAPRLTVRADALARMHTALAALRHPIHVFAIGTSEPRRQWGARKFTALADVLLERGLSVILLGGPAETALAAEIESALPAERKAHFCAITRNSLQDSAAVLALSDACIGNDTGVANMAAALGKPSYVLLGPLPLLAHDPLMRCISAARLQDIGVEDVVNRLMTDQASGFQAVTP